MTSQSNEFEQQSYDPTVKQADYSVMNGEPMSGGLGHYDYPVYERPARPTPQAERAAGYICTSEMVTE